MILHENKDLFKEAVIVTAQRMGICSVYVEKDYWVTYVLGKIFSDPIGEETIFKGGTALSKCYQLINRFWKILICLYCVEMERMITILRKNLKQ